MNLGEFDLDPRAPEGALASLRFERAPNELPGREGARAVVREALVSFVVWADVPVCVLEVRKLGRMELFLLEASLLLRRFELAELEVATSVPARVLAQSASGLVRRGTFRELAAGTYEVDEAMAARMLTEKGIEEENHRLVTFAYLPRQDVVIGDTMVAGLLLGVAKKLRAPRQAPFPPNIDRKKDVAAFLADRIAQSQVIGYPHKLVSLDPWEKPPSWPALSPCYFARGHVLAAGGEEFADIHLWGHERRKSAPRRYHGERLKLTHVEELLREWVSLAARFGTAFHGVAEGLPRLSAGRKEEIAKGQWRVALSYEEARAIAADRWLTDALPISACSATAKVDLRVSFEPVDTDAADLFAQDHVAEAVERTGTPYSPADFTQHIRRAVERFPLASAGQLTRARVEERLWSLKRFVAVYAHREQEDFAYA